VVKERVASINPMVVGSIPTGCESSVIEQRKKSRTADSRHNKTDVVKVRVTSAKERSGQPERCGIEKPPALQEAIAQRIKREPIVPIGSAGMVRRRVTSSVKRGGTVVPRLCSIFLPARICRKATELDVVKPKVPERKAPRERSDGENDEDERMEAHVSD